jgi:hypothetical protein
LLPLARTASTVLATLWGPGQLIHRPEVSFAIQAYLGHRNIQNTTRYMALAPVQGIFSGQGGLPIKCGVQLRKQYYFDRLSPGKQPLRSAHTTIEKEPAVVASKALFAGFRAARLQFRPVLAPLGQQVAPASAACEWAGMLALPSFWACG